MFWHNFKFAFKTLSRDRAMMFWTLVFPFALAIMFNLAFARIHDMDLFEPINVAAVGETESSENAAYREAFKQLSEGDERLFNTQYVSLSDADSMLDDGEIDGYVSFDESKPKIVVKENGTNQTVLAMAVEQIVQSTKIVEDIAAEKLTESPTAYMNAAQIYQEAIEIVANAKANVQDDSHVMNMIVIEFYTLIAMACMQGAMLSSEMTDRGLPNISNRGKRVAVAPTRKAVILGSNLLAGYIVLLVGVLSLIAFMRFVLGVEFGSDIRLICALAAAGSLAATMLGMFVSVILKTNSSAKNVVILVITMVGSLFAGMFGGQKNFFDNMAPLVNKISPVGLITDGYYALYYYEDMTRFWVNLASLLAVAAVMFLLSIRSLRRQRYDSI